LHVSFDLLLCLVLCKFLFTEYKQNTFSYVAHCPITSWKLQRGCTSRLLLWLDLTASLHAAVQPPLCLSSTRVLYEYPVSNLNWQFGISNRTPKHFILKSY
jgi:hypothetical protein